MRVLQEKFGVQVAYDPSLLPETSLGAFLPAEKTIFVSPSAVLEKNFSTLVHETAHAATYRNMRAGRPSPYYGQATGVSPYLPPNTGYDEFLVFDEMKSYWVDANHYRAASRKTGEGLVSPIMGPLSASRGLDLSTAVVRLTYDAQEQLKSGYQPKFERDALGFVVAVFELQHEEGLVTELGIPLVRSQGVADPANLELLTEQLESSGQEARKKIKEFTGFIKSYKGRDL